MGAVEDYASLIDKVNSQKERLQGPVSEDIWGGTVSYTHLTLPTNREV